jgi:putative protease
MNTLVKQAELADFLDNMVKAWNLGTDAFIIQDMYLGKYIKQLYPQIKLNLSTQAGVNNVEGAILAKNFGFERVILARETKLEDIKKIAEIIETEVFVQGALCTCFSGQCYLSSFAGGNSANRGKCKQPCRKKYSIDRNGFEGLKYAISLSDLSVGQDINKFIEAGVVSFKIEGRRRRPEYVAAAVTYYKNIISGSSKPSDLNALKRTYNRGNYTKGLAFGQDKSFISSAVQGHIGEYCGVIKVVDGKYFCQSNVTCSAGDCFKILRGGEEVGGANFSQSTRGGFYLTSFVKLKNADKVFITTDTKLNQSLLAKNRAKNITISADFTLGEKAVVTVDGSVYKSDFVLESAKSRPLSKDDIQRCFGKIDQYPFDVTFADIKIDGDIFVAASTLNGFRRDVYANYYSLLCSNDNQHADVLPINLPTTKNGVVNDKTAVIARSLCGVSADIGILKLDDYSLDTSAVEKLLEGFGGEKFIYLPVYMPGEELKVVENLFALFDGIYCDGYYAAEVCNKFNKKLFAGTGFNISNSIALNNLQVDYVALSKELTSREAREIATDRTFCLTAGDIKVMDLIYCPFEKTCKNCDKRELYTVTDDAGRKFPLRRYRTDACRFELYNCASLISRNNFTGKLFDCTLQDNVMAIVQNADDGEKLKKIFKNYTKGHTEKPVL